MRSSAGAGHAGYVHEHAIYDTDDELVDIVVPFLRDGIAAGEPTIVGGSARTVRLIRRAVGDLAVQFVPRGDPRERRPGPTLRAYHSIFTDLVAAGATRVRVVGDVPHPGVGADWHGWFRHEAAANVAFAPLPVWGICHYDTRITPAAVLDDVRCTHPFAADRTGGHNPEPGFVEPGAFVAGHPLRRAPSLRASDPDHELEDPSPAELRAAVRRMADDVLARGAIDDLPLAATEILANALEHGRSPTVARLWVGSNDVVVGVADAGPGPSDPLAGLVPPPPGRPGGRGLWIAHQLCTDVRFTDRPGFEVQLRMSANGLPIGG
ncbi:MAG: sensor histidine kinase [Actinomycetota bacterium]|nr:sensor histidine kinase [Actinomycetota bacterium]